MHNDITDVPGILIGHAHDEEALTGCTVVLCGHGAVAGVSVVGGAPGTRETDLLRPENLVSEVHAILLAGGSAFGLDAATGVMAYLEHKGIGFDTRVARVPIVPAAVIYDLGVGSPYIRPDARMGMQACENAAGGPIAQGCAGAGMGATVGKARGPGSMMKGGVGSASVRLASGETVGAICVVNAYGDVVDKSGHIVSGAIDQSGRFIDTAHMLLGPGGVPSAAEHEGKSTTLCVVATDAYLDKAAAQKVAQMAHDGLARAIRPVHTMFDGDTVFCVSTASKEKAEYQKPNPYTVTLVGVAAAEVVSKACVNACLYARSVGGIKCARDIKAAG